MAIIARLLTIAVGVCGASVLAEAGYEALHPAAESAAEYSIVGKAMNSGLDALHGVFNIGALAGEWTFEDEHDLSGLLHFGDEQRDGHFENWLPGDPVSSATVTKIGYGQVEFVTISTTSAGTYSSDSFYSPNVLYPGIDGPRTHGGFRHGNGTAELWVSGEGWDQLSVSGDSFTFQSELEMVNATGSYPSLVTCINTEYGSACAD